MRLVWIWFAVACHHAAAPSPTVPTCTATADHVRTLLGTSGERPTRIRDVFAERCNADAWSAEVRACVVATTSLRHPRRCKAKLTSRQRIALDRELAAVEAPSCSDYHALIEKLRSCSAVPPTERARFEHGYREIAQALVRAASFDRRALDAYCRSMMDGMRQAISSTCGW